MTSLVPYVHCSNHKQKVLRLYKEILRNLQSWYYYRPVFRYRATLMRACFDEKKNVSVEEGECLLWAAEKELNRLQHYQVIQFPYSVRGNAYGRVPYTPDWVLDFWHPLEKAQYPDYFRRREESKKEYIKMWEKQYGPSCGCSDSGH